MSQHTTVSWRCSAPVGTDGAAADAADAADALDAAGALASANAAPVALPAASAAMAPARRRRCPTDFTPICGQVRFGQGQQRLRVDVVVCERLRVALHSQLAKPCCNVHHELLVMSHPWRNGAATQSSHWPGLSTLPRGTEKLSAVHAVMTMPAQRLSQARMTGAGGESRAPWPFARDSHRIPFRPRHQPIRPVSEMDAG